MQERSLFRVSPCPGGLGGDLSGVVVPRHETAVAFARLCLRGIEIAIAFAGEKWVFFV